MAFPPYGTVFPTLSDFELSWLGYKFGGPTANPFQIKEIDGLDLNQIRTGDSGRPRDHGRFIGLDLMDGRDITVKGEILLTQQNYNDLSAVLVAGGTTESPLFFYSPWWGTLASMVRVRKHTLPWNMQAVLGDLATVTVMFSASDPRLYQAPQEASVTPSGVTNGFTFDLSFDLSFGGGSVVGVLSADNQGNIETRPILTVTGPATNPQIMLASAPGVPALTWDLTLNSGDKLVIDTDFHTAILYSAGSSLGSSALHTLAAGSTWFTLPANTTSTLQITDGTLTVDWSSAYIL